MWGWVEDIVNWADDSVGSTRRERRTRQAEYDAQHAPGGQFQDPESAALLAANKLPDDFDLLIREAMFAAAKPETSARAATFTTGPRGLEGPLAGVESLSEAVPGSNRGNRRIRGSPDDVIIQRPPAPVPVTPTRW